MPGDPRPATDGRLADRALEAWPQIDRTGRASIEIAMSRTACVIPWSSLILMPDGRASMCCHSPSSLTVDGRLGDLTRDSLEHLWNSSELVGVRAAMARGEKPEECQVCWMREQKGCLSPRLVSNSVYRRLGGRLALDSLPEEGAGSGYVLERRPDWFILEMGNACDLKCRSCNPLFSSRVAADVVQTAWATSPTGSVPGNSEAMPVTLGPPLRPRTRSVWAEDVGKLAETIASGADGNAMLSLLGGEPFLIDRTWRLLDELVARGVAPRIDVALSTNGQHRNDELERFASSFRSFAVTLSIDGHGKLYEYLRHGASWRKLLANLEWFRKIPNLQLSASPVLQNGNALDMVTLLRFLDRQHLPVSCNILNWPERLSIANLPPSVRRIAAARLRRYLDRECGAANATAVRGYCVALDEAQDGFDAELFREFMTFTNDLDASRGENLREAAPELVALIRAAGIEWPDTRRHTAPGAPTTALGLSDALRRVNRTISPGDVVYPFFEGFGPDVYFTTALSALGEIDARLREQGHAGLAGCRAIADFACHYGRIARALRAALPHAAVYACDLDPEAVRFCADELGALPVLTGWRPDEDLLPADLDAVLCISLLTHTPLEHWRRALRAWSRMLLPGGVAAFTYLGDERLDTWATGAMPVYGCYSGQQQQATIESARTTGFGFAFLEGSYGDERSYGVSFASREVVRREVTAAGLELLALPAGSGDIFNQELALVRKPAMPLERAIPQTEEPLVHRDVTLVAFYDPRCYAPAEGDDTGRAGNAWSLLAAARPQRPLPTELGFGDPRVPEVRELQASLARLHGVDAFCYLYPWGSSGPRWDRPLRDLLATGRPDFPFCLMLSAEDEAPLAASSAPRLFDEIAAALGDRRYLCVDGAKLLVVRSTGPIPESGAVARAWRDEAAARGLGGLHLCAVQSAGSGKPEGPGFDSFCRAPDDGSDLATVVTRALSDRWPSGRFFPSVECRRDAGESRSLELYEYWLHSAVEATRVRGERLVFIDSWNDWLRGRYLEPDDRDGRAALQATRRAARGPGSGLALLRRLRDALGPVDGPAAAVLTELEQVMAAHEHTRDRLLATVEVALGQGDAAGSAMSSGVLVPSRQLPPSGGHFHLDCVGRLVGPAIGESQGPIVLGGDKVTMAGWAHVTKFAPDDVELFIALEPTTGSADRVSPSSQRVARTDVVAVFPGFPPNCGFVSTLSLAEMAPGVYRVAIVQVTPDAAYRDATSVLIELPGAACSSD